MACVRRFRLCQQSFWMQDLRALQETTKARCGGAKGKQGDTKANEVCAAQREDDP